jgi:hypothetical protein
MANIIASFLTFLALSKNLYDLVEINFVYGKNDAIRFTYYDRYRLCYNEQFDKILLGACCQLT